MYLLKQQAAATPVFCAVDRNLDLMEGGLYWNNVSQCPPSVDAQDSVLAYRLWEISESLLIEKTEGFDTFFGDGDRFSSLTALQIIQKKEINN